MRLLISTEHHFLRTPDGVIHSKTGGREYRFWSRYLSAFDEILILGRVSPVAACPLPNSEVEGDQVKVVALPHYNGPADYLRRAADVREALKHISETYLPGSAVLLRVPGNVANLLWSHCDARAYPYGLEVVGDPYDVFSPGSVKNILRPIYRLWFARTLRKQCERAKAVSYVTQEALQRRYPPSDKAFSTYYSSVYLPDEAFVTEPKHFAPTRKEFTLITVGGIDLLYKAQDVLIDAVACCTDQAPALKLVIVGDGKCRHRLESQVDALNLQGAVSFLGQLPAGPAVREQLDAADVFVLPSRQEGVPRAMIEAMARGLPCIGSTIGGIPELLPPEAMVPPNDAAALAAKIREVLADPERMQRMAAHNLQKARDYHEDALRERRNAMYTHLREATEHWLLTHE